MKWCILSSIFFLICSPLVAGAEKDFVGTQFPATQLETLSGKKVTLPENRATLLLIGFQRECLQEAHEWAVLLTSEQLLPHSVHMYSVAVMPTGFFSPFVKSALRMVVPKRQHEQVGVVPNSLKKILADEKSASHVMLLLLDKGGQVRWHHAGKLTAETKLALKKIASTL